jgi:hypothetical protein
MPPRTFTSAVALVGLATLTSIEVGGCNKRPESLRSSTRAGLPLLTSALGSVSAEASYNLADYGVRPIPGVKYVCGHYELGPKGELLTRDLFAASLAPQLLQQALANARSDRDLTQARSHAVSLDIRDYSAFQVPLACRKSAMKDARSLLIASRKL